MIKETNMQRIREIATAFLYADIIETSVPFVASHPYTNSWFTMIPGEEGIVDLHDSGLADKWRMELRGQIEESNLIRLFMLMNQPYILNFLKLANKYMSDEDLGKVLGSFWQHIEQISLDNSVTGKDIIKMFERADKNTLMDEDERKTFESLPDEVTVYRGVTSYNRKKKKAFSWTTSRDVAEWFANRFNTGTGEVWTVTVPKDRILCAFDGGEKELIVNLYGFNGDIQIEEV